MAINLSVHQLRQDDLVTRIQHALDRYHVEASQLLCEITESVAMEDIKVTHRAFDGLGRTGVYLSIDDFGTGYSSLSYLRKLPARQLKIDGSFIKDLEIDNDARAVVDAVVRLAHALGLDVVAEGVESAEQRDILLSLGAMSCKGSSSRSPCPPMQCSNGQTSIDPRTASISSRPVSPRLNGTDGCVRPLVDFCVGKSRRS